MLETERLIARWPMKSLDYFNRVSKAASFFHSPPATYLPPNFLFPSRVSAFTAPPASSYSPSPSPSSHEEMARIKRPPKSITLKPRKCELCHLNRQSGNKPRSPVEKEEYFIDNDGTLTIKNGVCPRRLAIRLFAEVSKSGPKYEELLGENIVKFLLNLKQIIDRHQDTCPDEDRSHLVVASNVLKLYVNGPYVVERSSKSQERPKDVVKSAGSGIPEQVLSHMMSRVIHSGKDSSPEKRLQQSSHSPRLLSTGLLNLPGGGAGGLSPAAYVSSDAVMDFEGSKGAASDKCSSEASSRVASPAPSLSSITSGLSSTKRGTKILPVASNDGQTRYVCPVCSLELSNDHELTVHIRSHNQAGQQSTPNTCTICKKTLSSQSSLDRHMLVHSGERPFKCKICDMSFTTNGNMHRHARIHEKNSLMGAKPQPGRKPTETKQPSKKESPLVSGIIAGSPSMVSQPQFPNIIDYYRSFVHPAYPTFPPAWYPDGARYPFLTLEDVTPEILMPKRPRLSETVREPSPDLRSPKSYPCNVCNKTFTNQFHLDSHMEEHVIVDHHLEAEAGAACKTCKTVAKSEESLLLHIMTHHKKEESLAEPDVKPGKKSPSSPSQSSSTSTSVGNNSLNTSSSHMGFQELGFASFTCRKFPLIAKAFCESNPKVKGSKQPVFKCNECSKEFPVEGAKDLHEASHIHEEYTKCPQCDCHFTESSRLQEHMLKHVADVKFEQILDKSGMALENLSQNHFLAQFGLMPKEDDDDITGHENSGEDIVKCEPTSEDVKQSLTDDDDDNESLSSTHFISASSAKSRPLMSSSPYDSDSEHDSLMPPTFPCKYCEKVLTSQQELTSHENSHKNVSQLQCLVCSYTSTDKSSLMRHMRTHSGERPFKCGICAYSFTTKANCERHMKQKHGLEKDQLSDNLIYNEYVINSKSDFPSSSMMSIYSSGTSALLYQCKVCKVEFQQKQALELHMQSTPKCRLAFLCTLCMRPFKSKSSAFNHFLTVHPEVPSNLQDGYIISSSENSLSTHSIPALTSPPPAHSKTPALPPYNLPHLDDLICPLDKLSTRDIKPAVGLFHNKRLSLDVESSDRPLDFSKPETKKVFELSSHHQRTLSGSFSEDDQQSDDVPIDLSVQRPSGSLSCRKSLIMKNQSPYSITRQSKDHSGMHNDSPKWLSPSGSLDNSYPNKRPRDGNNNHLSSMSSTSASRLLPFSESQNLLLTLTAEPKNLPLMLVGASAQQSAFPSPSSSKSGILPIIPSQLILTNPSSSVNEKNRSEKQMESAQSLKNDKKNTNTKVDVEESDANSHLKSLKGSPSESDSSCELASVNRIIDAANAQTFQEYLIIPENEDEPDEKSESVSSCEDSNQSMENLYSNSQSFNSETLQSLKSNDSSITRQDDSNSEDSSGNNEGLPSVTVNVALIDNTLPKVFMERPYKKNKNSICDPSNMSEQAIAELIEKVSKENSSSPAKKKRNSYADSPHKFSCPYCPRCFPWLSSLNRHLLTHTGQKPFKCPRCPVTFSTKSNRERHLIRKHNVNMLDPASRSTMDRPYKCHLCVFSSFSTQSNLIKHYKDRHDGVSPPAQVLEMMDRSLSDGEGEDGQFNGNGASYEDEEEYNSLVEMRGLSDKEIMLQNYNQDSNHGGNTTLDPHKKRNAIFNLGSDDDQITSKLSPTKSVQGGTTRPGIDDTVLTDTMKQFLDKSVKQAVEDSQRRAMEKGSKFILTPYIERHLRHLPPSDNVGLDLTLYPRERCPKCDKEFLNQKILIKHLKHEHGSDLPYKCHICESSFSSRVDCLQHQAQMHHSEWNTLKDKNDIGNVQVFGTRLDKMIEKLCKRGRDILEKQGQKSEALITATKNKKNFSYMKKLDLQSASKLSHEDNIEKLEMKKNIVQDTNKNGEEMADKGVLEEVITSDYLQRKIYCALCPKRFWSMQDLKRHMRSHTGERPYRCDICFQKFTLKHSMKRHKANHHPDHMNTQDATSDDDASGSDGSSKATSIHSSIPSLSVLTSGAIDSQTASATNGDVVNDGNNNQNKSSSDDDKDMLHNLLGVESSTIDQILESNDSAESLLGVSPK